MPAFPRVLRTLIVMTPPEGVNRVKLDAFFQKRYRGYGPLHSSRSVTRTTIVLSFINMHTLAGSDTYYKTRRKVMPHRKEEEKIKQI